MMVLLVLQRKNVHDNWKGCFMVFRVGVGKKIGGFNFFLGKTISSSSKKRVANSPRVQQPSVKDTKDKEFKDFLYKCERDTNYFIMDFFELNGYDPKR